MDFTPQQAFIEERIITDDFVEAYIYGHLLCLKDEGLFSDGDGVVLGWDTRDEDGLAISGAIRGILRGGGVPLSIGAQKDGKPIRGSALPTPAVPLYMIKDDIPVGFMLTASHNPASQNGVKVFIGPFGMKAFPEDEVRFTKYVMDIDCSSLPPIEEPYNYEDRYEEAVGLYISTLHKGVNSWRGSTLSKYILVVDHSNGSLIDIARRTLENTDLDHLVEIDVVGKINEDCGVVDLEGSHFISREEIAEGALFGDYSAFKTAYDIAYKRGLELKEDKLLMVASFDGDGDRFYISIYDPYRDGFIVLSGDKLGVILAKNIYGQKGESVENLRFVNSIESSISSAEFAEEVNFDVGVVPVGDKWLQWEAVLNTLEILGVSEFSRLSTPSTLEVSKYIKEEGIDVSVEGDDLIFGVAFENSGHIITDTIVDVEGGSRYLYTGDGLKSCINTLYSIANIYSGFNNRNIYESLYHLLPEEYKVNQYIYYTEQERLRLGSEVYEGVGDIISDFCEQAEVEQERVSFEVTPDLLYYRLSFQGSRIGVIFVRNSGTEIKTGVYVQGLTESARLLHELTTRVMDYLYDSMKDYRMVETVVQAEIVGEVLNKGELRIEDAQRIYERRKSEVGVEWSEFSDVLNNKEKLVSLSDGEFEVTEKGRLFIKRFNRKER